jgi:hypothetical protein
LLQGSLDQDFNRFIALGVSDHQEREGQAIMLKGGQRGGRVPDQVILGNTQIIPVKMNYKSGKTGKDEKKKGEQ